MKPEPRVAFISGQAGCAWGGSELLWSQAATRLLADGHPVFVSVKHWPETPAAIQALRAAGAEVDERHEDFPDTKSIMTRLVRRYKLNRAAATTWSRLRRFRPHLVCISHGSTNCGLEWMVRCRDEQIPYVSVSQANAEQWWPTDELAELGFQAHAAARRSYFVSRRNLQLFEAQTGQRLANAEVIANPFQVPYESHPAWPGGTCRLACVGRLDAAAKGQDLILELLASEPWRDRDLAVSFFGNGVNERSLRRYAETLGFNGKVEFAGHVPDVTRIWETHHALLLPSRFEGLPLAVVEAMLCGRVPIVTAAAADTEALIDGETGFVAEAPTVGLLSQALQRAWDRRAEWAAIGAKARTAIRRVTPPDPAGAFAAKLLAL